MVSVREGLSRSLDTARPPHGGQSTRGFHADDHVLPDRVRVELASDEREIVKVRAARVEPGAHRNQRSRSRGGRELENLIRISGRGEVQDPALVIVDQARRVGEAQKRSERPTLLDGQPHHEVLVLAGHEERRFQPFEDLPEISARPESQEGGVEISRFLPMS